MKILVQRLRASPRFSEGLALGKLVAVTGSAQIVIQAIGFISSILIIRMLSTGEYAIYTLANTILGTMVLLADAGVSTGVMAQGGKVWQDQDKLGVVFSTGMSLRKKFALVSLIIAIPILIFMLKQHNVSWIMCLVISLSLIPSFFTSLSNTLLEIIPKLKQDIVQLQKIQVIVNAGRLIMLLAVIFAFPFAYIAILVAGISQIWGNYKLKNISSGHANIQQKSDPIIRRELISIVKRILPGAIYYSASGQITIWLATIFGSSETIAQIGALGRLAAMLSIVTAIFNTIISPRFARIVGNRYKLFTNFFKIQSGILFFSFFIILTVWLFPSEILWVLGNKYSGLNKELLLSVSVSCINLITGTSFVLASNRGWAINPFFTIPIEIVSIVVGLFIFDISTLHGVLLLNIFIALIQMLMNSSYMYLKIYKYSS